MYLLQKLKLLLKYIHILSKITDTQWMRSKLHFSKCKILIVAEIPITLYFKITSEF